MNTVIYKGIRHFVCVEIACHKGKACYVVCIARMRELKNFEAGATVDTVHNTNTAPKWPWQPPKSLSRVATEVINYVREMDNLVECKREEMALEEME